MYYPVAVGGPITKTIDGMIAEFEKANPDIKVKAVYAGNYDDTRVKALAALKANQPVQLSVLFSIDVLNSSTRASSFPSMSSPPRRKTRNGSPPSIRP